MNPLLVVPPRGRSGTTLLMRILASHPQIIAHEQYPLEFYPFLHSVFPEKTDPGAAGLTGGVIFDRMEHLLLTPYRTNGRIEPFEAINIYQSLAQNAPKTPLYFAEKCLPWLDLQHATLREQGARFIFLIRDPRDVLLSSRAFSARTNARFIERSTDSDEETVIRNKLAYDNMIEKAEHHRSEIVRYEDLIQGRLDVLATVLDRAGLDSTEAVLRECTARAAAMEDGRHTTSTNINSSIGKWRNEMSQQMIDLYQKHFSSIFRRFQY